MDFIRLNNDTPRVCEFNQLINKLFNKTEDMIEDISKETKTEPKEIEKTINKYEYPEMTEQDIYDMVVEKSKYYKREPVDNPKHLRKELENFRFYENYDEKEPAELPKIPDSILQDIISDSTENIHKRLHERAENIDRLVISEQELREYSGILNHIGNCKTKIESLKKTGDEYRLKALNEPNGRNEQFYKNISETAVLKADYIRITEICEEPFHEESCSIIENVVENNEP